MIKLVVDDHGKDQTLISFLKKRLWKVPLNLIYKLFRKKKIEIDNETVRYYHHRLRKGEIITISDDSLIISEPKVEKEKKIIIDNDDIEIAYEDDNLIVVKKDHNLEMSELDKQVKSYFFCQDPVRYRKLVNSYFYFTSIHRIDKLTKGLVIYAKNPKAKIELYKAIKDQGKLIRNYLAICENNDVRIPRYIEGFIKKDEQQKKMIFSLASKDKEAKKCSLEIETIDRRKDILLEINLCSGRKHQIRSILSFLGIPIKGDKKYGSRTFEEGKIKLFAYKLHFKNLGGSLSYLNGKTIEMKDQFV